MPNLLLNYMGELEAGEIFIHSLAVDSGLVGQEAAAALAGGAMTDAQGTNPLGISISSDVTYSSCSAAEILDLSSGTLAAANHYEFLSNEFSGSGTGGAYQVAMAISLTAGVRPNGTPLRGRFYMPVIGTSAQNSGNFTGAMITEVGDFVSDWFDNLVTQGLQPSVWSRALGALQPVTAVRIGDTIDTIRSRRNSLPENYETVWTP